MASRHRITINGRTIFARHGELLLDAAVNNGVSLPYDCRAGHCGTCCVRLLSGSVQGGQGSEPDIVHACKCRIISDANVEKAKLDDLRSVAGEITSMEALSADVMEVGISTNLCMPYRPGQYVQLSFSGYPSRPFSITHPICAEHQSASLWFHIRRMKGGEVTSSLGTGIKVGHRVTLKGPYGSAHFRPDQHGRLILVATNTGFAPIWSIAVAALRENPERPMMIIAGGRELGSLYMGPALVRLAMFPNVSVFAVSSTPQTHYPAVRHGRPTDFLPRLLPSDVVYVCGVPGMVDAVKAIAQQYGAVCHADPFVPVQQPAAKPGILARTTEWIARSKTASDRFLKERERVEPHLADAWGTKG